MVATTGPGSGPLRGERELAHELGHVDVPPTDELAQTQAEDFRREDVARVLHDL